MLYEKLELAACHAYSIKPFISEDGLILISVTNPWNTSNSIDITLNEFEKNFRVVQYAKVK